MSERLDARVWIGAEVAAIVVAAAACLWSFAALKSDRVEPVVSSAPIGAGTSGLPVADDAITRTMVPMPSLIWPREEREARAAAVAIAKVAPPPPLELVGIVTDEAGRAIGAMVYDSRSDTTLVIAVGAERSGVRVRGVTRRRVEIELDGVGCEFTLSGGPS